MISGRIHKGPRTRPYGERDCDRCGIAYIPNNRDPQLLCRDCLSVLAYVPRRKPL